MPGGREKERAWRRVGGGGEAERERERARRRVGGG